MSASDPCPFLSKLFFPESRIERICANALEEEGLMPSEPEPIRIDRFIEKRFGITIDYVDLESRFGVGVMGACGFDRNGNVEAVLIERTLDEQDTKISHKRVRSTLAHECGHGLLHGPLFAERYAAEEQMKDALLPRVQHEGVTSNGFACRSVGKAPSTGRRSDWWEVQANMAMAAMLLPRKLVDPFVEEIMAGPRLRQAPAGNMIQWPLDLVSQSVADKFDVSISMATYRIHDLHRSLLREPTLL